MSASPASWSEPSTSQRWMTTNVSPSGSSRLYRRWVDSLAPGWRAEALPLTPDNDHESGSFPLSTVVPGTAMDTDLMDARLTLYRLFLQREDRLVRTPLYLVKAGDDIELRY